MRPYLARTPLGRLAPRARNPFVRNRAAGARRRRHHRFPQSSPDRAQPGRLHPEPGSLCPRPSLPSRPRPCLTPPGRPRSGALAHHLPTLLPARDVFTLLDHLEAPYRLIAELLYGAGLRLDECLALRVKDIDFERHPIMVRRGKGARDRPALLPERARDRLRRQLALVEERHDTELAAGRGEVDLPEALRAKLPNAGRSFAWQYVFPTSRPCTDPAGYLSCLTGAPCLLPQAATLGSDP